MGRKSQLVQGLLFGIAFGFLLHKGGVTRYDVIIGQLLLEDFTVVKVILSAVLTGMIGVHGMKHLGWVRLSPKAGSWSQNVIGGLVFGAGFALLGYCPGTIAAAIGNGFLDALYPRLRDGILRIGYYGDVTLPRLLQVGDGTVIVPLGALLALTLFLLERAGL